MWLEVIHLITANLTQDTLTSIVEIINGKLDRCLMFGDSENDADAAKAANIPMILLEDGYTDKKIEQIYHNHLITDFVNVEKIVSKYLNG